MQTQSQHPPILLSTIIDNRPTATREDGKSLNFENFCSSIREIGLIQPLVINRIRDNNSFAEGNWIFDLAAGGRRLKALKTLGFTEVFHASSCDPSHPGYVFADELTEAQKLEVELDENIQRRNITWQDEVLSIARVHEARTRSNIIAKIKGETPETWGQRQTGALLNVPLGRVSETLLIAVKLRSSDKEILDASSFMDALRVLLQRKVDVANALLVKEGLSSVNTSIPPNVSTDSPKKRPTGDVIVLFDDEEGSPSRSSHEQDLGVAPGVDADGTKTSIVPLSQMLFLGPLENVVPKVFPDNFFDFGLCDIPYGIDMANLDLKNQSRIDKEHDVSDNINLIPSILEQYFRVLKEQSFLCLFYDLDHHNMMVGEDVFTPDVNGKSFDIRNKQKVIGTWSHSSGLAERIGFKVQRWPDIWHKTHPCRNQAPQYNFTKDYESILILRKGNATLNKPQNKGTFSFDGAVERKMYDNPFAKPFDMWKVLIDACALPGMKVADFCAGEGSSLRAAIMCGLMPYGVEISELHYNALTENIKSAYKTLTRGKVEFQ